MIKRNRQPQKAVMIPPSAGPRVCPKYTINKCQPRALPLSFAGKMSTIKDLVLTIKMAEPIPVIAL